MKRILSAFLLFSFTLSAQVPDEVHEKCKDVADYVGCVQIFTGSVKTKQESGIPEVKELKKALGLLPSRLQNTSLRDFSMEIQPFTDALASAKSAEIAGDYSLDEKIQILQITNPSILLGQLIDTYRSSIGKRIDLEVELKNRIPFECAYFRSDPSMFNVVYGKNVIRYLEEESIFGFNYCETKNYNPYGGVMLFLIIEASKEIIQDLNPFSERGEEKNYNLLREEAFNKNDLMFSKYEKLEAEIENNWSKTDREEGKNSKYNKWQKKMHSFLGKTLLPMQENLISINARFTSSTLWSPSGTAKQIIEMENLMREVQHYSFPDKKFSPKYHNEYIYEHYKLYLAALYFNLSDGDRKSNLLAAEKLLISFLGYGWNNFETCKWTLGSLTDVHTACIGSVSSALTMHERIKKELNQLAS
jgi:hypothetical protein